MIESRTVGAEAINNYPNRFLIFAQLIGTAQYYLNSFVKSTTNCASQVEAYGDTCRICSAGDG